MPLDNHIRPFLIQIPSFNPIPTTKTFNIYAHLGNILQARPQVLDNQNSLSGKRHRSPKTIFPYYVILAIFLLFHPQILALFFQIQQLWHSQFQSLRYSISQFTALRSFPLMQVGLILVPIVVLWTASTLGCFSKYIPRPTMILRHIFRSPNSYYQSLGSLDDLKRLKLELWTATFGT